MCHFPCVILRGKYLEQRDVLVDDVPRYLYNERIPLLPVTIYGDGVQDVAKKLAGSAGPGAWVMW